MGYTAQNSKDFLALARMLRDYAMRHEGDSDNALFLSTAAMLEGQARLAARAAAPRAGDLKRGDVLHNPVNVII